MKVLQVMAGAAQGGAETAFEDIVLALHESGIEQRVVVRGNNPYRVNKIKSVGIPVDTLPFGGALDIYTPLKMRSVIADFKPDIVQTWMSRASQKTPHCAGSINVARLGGYYNLKYYKNTDFFVANTPDIKNYLIEKGVAEDRVVHINNFAPIDDPSPDVNRADLGVPDGAQVAVALARYHPVKALDTLIRAAAELPTLHVWLAGQGPEEGRLRALADELQCAERIHVLGWRRDGDALLRAADICVVPSRSEPFGNVMVQAWAQGCPLICSRSQGPLQFARDGQNSLMFDIDDVAALKAHLQRLINDSDLRQKLRDAGAARFQNEFSREKTVMAYRNFYDGILARHGK